MTRRAEFAAELARLRAASGRSLADVADAAHVNRTHLSHVEHLRRWPSRPVVEALDVALGADGNLLGRWLDAERAGAAPPILATATDPDPIPCERPDPVRTPAGVP